MEIHWSEAFELMQEHGIKSWSETGASSYSDGVCVLKNGWEITFVMVIHGPYSEVTPDVDVQLKLTLEKKKWVV